MKSDQIFNAIVQQAWAGNSEWIGELRRSLSENPELIVARQADGSTLLHKAFSYAFLLQELLAFGAEVNARNNDGLTPLYYAAKWVRADAVEVLLRHGANANIADEEGKTPLHWAVVRGRPDVIKLLLAAGADTSAREKAGNTARQVAQESGKLELAEVLE